MEREFVDRGRGEV